MCSCGTTVDDCKAFYCKTRLSDDRPANSLLSHLLHSHLLALPQVYSYINCQYFSRTFEFSILTVFFWSINDI